MLDLATLRLAARLAKAAYGDTPAGAVAEAQALGFEGIAKISVGDVNALIAHRDGRLWIAPSGTHFSQNTSWSEIRDNLDGDAVDIGVKVHDGYWGRTLRLWWQIRELIEGPVVITGHSLGGVTGHLLAYQLPADLNVTVYSFGAPKGADAAFWRAVYRPAAWFRVVHEKDFAPTWPETGPFEQPGPMLWLHDGKLIPDILARPGVNESYRDHDEDAYIAALDALPDLMAA